VEKDDRFINLIDRYFDGEPGSQGRYLNRLLVKFVDNAPLGIGGDEYNDARVDDLWFSLQLCDGVRNEGRFYKICIHS
jgi:hypothetical protein